jgi:hypothetical protein
VFKIGFRVQGVGFRVNQEAGGASFKNEFRV